MKTALSLGLAVLATSCTPPRPPADAPAAPREAAVARPSTPADAPRAPPADAAPTPPADAVVDGPTGAWATMSRAERVGFMEDTVLPEMQRMFREFDARKYARFTCATCHGANARAVRFRMPNGLDPLTPSRIPARYTSQRPMDVFMTRRVLPRMAQLLGKPVYTPETQAGFGCFGCHGMRPEAGVR